jgi:hypothetical protein
VLKQALFRGRELIVIVTALGRSCSGPSRRKRKKKRVESRVAYVQPIANDRQVIVTSPGELLLLLLCMQNFQVVESCNVTRDDHVCCGWCTVLRHKYVEYAKHKEKPLGSSGSWAKGLSVRGIIEVKSC